MFYLRVRHSNIGNNWNILIIISKYLSCKVEMSRKENSNLAHCEGFLHRLHQRQFEDCTKCKKFCVVLSTYWFWFVLAIVKSSGSVDSMRVSKVPLVVRWREHILTMSDCCTKQSSPNCNRGHVTQSKLSERLQVMDSRLLSFMN